MFSWYMLLTQGNLMRKRRDFGTKYFICYAVYPKMKWWYLLETRMGISEVVMLAMMGHADGSSILEVADGLNLVICNTLFTKQEAKLVTYVAGPVKSTVDYIMVRQEDKAKVRNVKVISSQECVPKHKLLVMDVWFKATKSWHRKFEPRVHVWKLKEEKTSEEYRCMVGDKV